MQRNSGKSSDESKSDEISNNRRQNYRRDRDEEDRNYPHNRAGISRYCNPVETQENFDNYQQQMLQQKFQEFQLARKENIDSSSPSRSMNRRMGAVLPSPTPPGSIQGRSVSVPPTRRERYGTSLPPPEDYSEDVSYEPSILELQTTKKYSQGMASRSPKNSVSRGNGGVTNVDSDADYYVEIDAATSTSTTNGKMKFLNKLFDKTEKSEKSLKKEKKSKEQNVKDDDKGPSVSRSRKNDVEPYGERRNLNPFLDDENEVYDNDPSVLQQQPSRDPPSANIKRRSSRQGSSQYVPRASDNSFISPSELNSNYDLIYAEARRAVDPNILSRESSEILPLPLEIPESVADEEAFRRYLSVRRGATCNHHLDHLPLQSFLSVPISEQLANVGSTGEQGGSKSSSGRSPVNQVQNKMLPPGEAHKRTLSLSHAIMTLALLCASAAQLRFFVAYSHAHTYPAINYFLVCTCIIIEVLVGIGYLLLSRFTINEERAELIHSFLIFGLFIVAAVNVIICAFALDDHICEMIVRNTNPELYDSVDQSLPTG